MFTNIILNDLYGIINFSFYKGNLWFNVCIKNNIPLIRIDREYLNSSGMWRCNYCKQLSNEKIFAWIGFRRKDGKYTFKYFHNGHVPQKLMELCLKLEFICLLKK